MQFDYDPETDSLYIKLFDRPGVESSEVAPGIVFDYDMDGIVVGIDIEHASQVTGFLPMLRSAIIQRSHALAVA